HRRHQREMLIDHAEPERVGIFRVGDGLLAAADQHIAFGRVVVAHDAFDQRAFSRAVLAKQRVKRAGLDLQFDLVKSSEIAEPHGHGDGLDAKRPARQRRVADHHEIAPIRSADVATAPNTPPCILIIFSAWSWLLLSVAAQQSSTSTHSKPRSLASRIVVWTQTSVVMPVSTMFSMPRSRSISSRS